MKTAVGANWAYEQVRVLCSLGIEVVVALPSDTEGLAPKYRQAGATVLRANLDFPARQPWRIPATLRACRQLVADVRPDLIHTHHVGPTFITRLALGKNSKIPRVFGVTGTLHLEHDFFAWLDTHSRRPARLLDRHLQMDATQVRDFGYSAEPSIPRLPRHRSYELSKQSDGSLKK